MTLGKKLGSTHTNFDLSKVSEFIDLFNKSQKFDEKNYKSWHHYELLNFNFATHYEQRLDKEDQKIIDHMLMALKGFIKYLEFGSTVSAQFLNRNFNYKIL